MVGLCAGRGGAFIGYAFIEEGGVRERESVVMIGQKKNIFPHYLEGIVAIFIISAIYSFGNGV